MPPIFGPILWAGGEESSAISRGLVAGRAVVDRRTIHIHDMATESETEFPEGLSFQKRTGHRTILATPLHGQTYWNPATAAILAVYPDVARGA